MAKLTLGAELSFFPLPHSKPEISYYHGSSLMLLRVYFHNFSTNFYSLFQEFSPRLLNLPAPKLPVAHLVTSKAHYQLP